MNLRNSLHTSVEKILKEVESLTSKGFSFIEKPGLQFLAIVKTARSSTPNHQIIYNPTFSDLINHLIAHECGHIIRIYNTPPDKRFVPFSTPDMKTKALQPIENQINSFISSIGYTQGNKLIDLFYHGIIRQVTNLPIDLLIEKWLYNSYPELREIQLKSLINQNQQALQGLNPKSKSLFPEFFYNVSNTMNYAYTDLLSKIVKYKLIREWKSSSFRSTAQPLYDFINIETEWPPEQDYDIINQWSNHLHLTSFFSWLPFESLPDNYFDTY